jgi:hypothetical protein
MMSSPNQSSSSSSGGSGNDANAKLEALLQQDLELEGKFEFMETTTNHKQVKISKYVANVNNSRKLYSTGRKWLKKVMNIDL